MGSIGTLAWARRTQGRLSAREMVAFTAQGVRSQMAELSAHAAHALGIRRERLASVDLESVRAPDTAAAREAREVCDALAPYLRNHSYRSWLWAIALAEHDGLAHDEELLYCACLIHDAGVPRALERRSAACFTLASAEIAEQTAASAGWPRERGDRLAEALTLHVNAHLPPEQGVEAHLLASGALVDGIGRRAWLVEPAYREAVLARHPRLGMKRAMNADLRAHAKQAPGSRIAFYYRYGALGLLIGRAPYPE